MKTLFTLAALAALTLQAQQTPAPAKAELTPIPATAQQSDLLGHMTVPPTLTLNAEQKLGLRDDERKAVAAEWQRNEALQKFLDSPEYRRLEAAAIQASQQFQRTANVIANALGCPECKIDLNTWVVTRPPAKEEKKEK